jgi:hypothetical protein
MKDDDFLFGMTKQQWREGFGHAAIVFMVIKTSDVMIDFFRFA